MKKYWLLLLLVIPVILVARPYLSRQLSGRSSQSQRSYTVKRQDIKEILNLAGEVSASEKATLRFSTSGRLAWVGIKEGDRVKKFQTIASLDQRELKKKLQKYLNTFSQEFGDFDQTHEDNRDKVLTDAVRRIYNKSQKDLDNTVLDVEIQNLAIEYSSLWTPVEGIVTRIDAPNAGVNIIPTQAEFEVVNPGTLYLSVLADQSEVIQISSGQTAQLVLDAFPNKSLSGTVSRISFSPKSGESSTVYEVQIPLPVSQVSGLRLGMTGDATFTLKDKTGVLAIPSEFINTEDDKKYVFKSPDKKEKTYIKTGLETDELTEVTSGLSENEIIYD